MKTPSSTPVSFPAPTALLSVGLTVVLWASAFPAIRVSLRAFGPAELAALRFTIASVALGLYMIAIRPSLPRLSDLPRLVLASGLGITAYNLLLNTGEGTVDAGTASFLVNTGPVFTALLGMALLRERLSRRAWIGIAICLVGTTLIATQHGRLGFGSGSLLILGAAACQASQFVIQKPLLARYGALPVTACLIWAGTLMLMPFLPGALGTVSKAPAIASYAILFLGLGPAALAYLAWSRALSILPVSRAATFLYLVPPISTLIAWLSLAEAPTPRGLVGGAIALAGVIVVNAPRRQAVQLIRRN